MKKNKRIGKVLPVLTIIMILISGCGSKSEVNMRTEETYAAAYYDYAGGIEEALPDAAAEGISYNSSASKTVPMETGSDLNLDSVVQKRKLIRNVNVSLETEKYDSVNENIRNQVIAYGGYIENYSEYRGSYNYSSNRSSDITARIPAEKVDSFLNNSFQDAYITSMSENTQDITLQYSDLETRLASLTTERDRLLEILKKAEDVESIIAIEERLTQVRYELESIQSSLKNYDNKVDYSTVWISLCEVKKVEVSEEASFLERIVSGFRKSTAELADALEDFAVWFLSNILSILLFVAVVFAIVKVIIALNRKAKEKKESKKNTRDNNDHDKTATGDEYSADSKEGTENEDSGSIHNSGK